MKMLTPYLLGAITALVSVTSGASAAGEQAFIELFGGSWAGSATVIEHSVPMHVTCQVAGRPATNHITIEGNCSLAIFSVRIAADITYDPGAHRYSGTYIGAEVGPARVSGRRNGNVLDLAVTWPRVINGDAKARMTIENDGGGGLRITTFDNVVVGGPEEWTSDADLRHVDSVARR